MSPCSFTTSATGRSSATSRTDVRSSTPPVRAALAPVAGWGSDTTNDEAILGTDNFDFLLEGVPNLVAIQETERYLADYHASSDTFDKVDLELAKRNAAVAAVAVLGLANAPGAAGRAPDPRRDPEAPRRPTGSRRR